MEILRCSQVRCVLVLFFVLERCGGMKVRRTEQQVRRTEQHVRTRLMLGRTFFHDK